MQRLGLGLIGAGSIGRLHGENITYHVLEAELLSVADVALEVANETAKTLIMPKVAEDYHE